MTHLDKHGGSVLSSFLALLGVHEDPKTDDTFVGTWIVKDSDGDRFEITLSSSGAAEADREGEGMRGNWEVDGASAVIAWNTGWVTKITRTGDTFTKTAYDTTATTPTNVSEAEKIFD